MRGRRRRRRARGDGRRVARSTTRAKIQAMGRMRRNGTGGRMDAPERKRGSKGGVEEDDEDARSRTRVSDRPADGVGGVGLCQAPGARKVPSRDERETDQRTDRWHADGVL